MVDEQTSRIEETLREFVTLEQKRRELEAELDRMESRRKELVPILMGEFEKIGMSSAKVDGMTVYIHRQLWASAKDGNMEGACQALKENGLGEYVAERFNVNSLSAYVREMDKDGIELPGGVKEAIHVEERFDMRTRKGG